MSVLLIEEIKQRIHQTVNKLQAILGYIELAEYEKAQAHTLLAAEDMHQLSKMLSGCSIIVTKDTAIVVPAAAAKEMTITSVKDVRKVLKKIDDRGLDNLPQSGLAIVPRWFRKNE